MAKYGPGDVLILVDGYNLGIDLFEAPLETSALLEASHTFGDIWTEMADVGVKSGTLSVRGFYEDADNRSNETLVDGLTTQDRVSVALLERLI